MTEKDKYNRDPDPWHDAEVVPLWFFLAVILALLIAIVVF